MQKDGTERVEMVRDVYCLEDVVVRGGHHLADAAKPQMGYHFADIPSSDISADTYTGQISFSRPT
jgi:hypothetical protein